MNEIEIKETAGMLPISDGGILREILVRVRRGGVNGAGVGFDAFTAAFRGSHARAGRRLGAALPPTSRSLPPACRRLSEQQVATLSDVAENSSLLPQAGQKAGELGKQKIRLQILSARTIRCAISDDDDESRATLGGPAAGGQCEPSR